MSRLIVLKPSEAGKELVYKNTASAKSDNNDKIGESSQTQINIKTKSRIMKIFRIQGDKSYKKKRKLE